MSIFEGTNRTVVELRAQVVIAEAQHAAAKAINHNGPDAALWRCEARRLRRQLGIANMYYRNQNGGGKNSGLTWSAAAS